MATDDDGRLYWTRHTNGHGHWNTRAGNRQPEGPPGADLAALRRGLGREPGSVPAMWRYYTKLNEHGLCTKEYAAEHAALTLFAVHQQSQSRPMHRERIGLGTALLILRQHDESVAGAVDWSRVDPVDRRFNAAATATDLTELVQHLRGLVTQLRGIAQPLDYTALFGDLCRWPDPADAAAVRRRWGMQYFTRTKPVTGTTEPEPEPAEESS